MHDIHRSKPELIHELTGLRKQVSDLKESMLARRRVEDALRESETMLRLLADGAPVGLALFQQDGTLVAANRPLATMLGYQSPADLLSVAAVLGVFASPEDQSRALVTPPENPAAPQHATFRLKSGCRRRHRVLAKAYSEPQQQVIGVVVFDALGDPSQSFPAPPA
jgi:PAS domain S-box-containing protein